MAELKKIADEAGRLAALQCYEILDTPLHLISGYVTFMLTLVLLFLFAERSDPGASS